MTTSTSTSSSQAGNRWAYDVFISFRGEDTRDTFAGYLYSHLGQKGIITFICDEGLKPGEQIKPAVLKAIQGSRIAVVIFSRNYASSSWCLNELTEIVQCSESKGQIIIPVFYRIDPFEVQDVSRALAKAIVEHERMFPDDFVRVQKWKEALHKASSNRFWHLTTGNEAEFVKRIAEEISTSIGRTLLYVAKHPVGIDFHLEELQMLSEDGPQEVRMIGIWGVGGIGKTTAAKAYYNSIYKSFECSSFLANVRETSKRYNGLVQLQELLLYDSLRRTSDMKVGNVARGINMIRERLQHKRVLIVLDDVDHLDQLTALAGGPDWFGPGSRIIITTRDGHLLVAGGIERKYKMKGLNDEDALQLLCWNSFGIPYPPDEYEGVASFVMKYAKGLPLALNVLGSFLRKRSKTEWLCAIKKFKEIPDADVHEILKVSFDALGHHEKFIFLDVACFFKGENRDHVMKLLENCNLYPDIGIAILVDKSLIYIEGNELHMHDLVQQMGREIVRKESSNPGRRSRLWFHEDVLQVLEENTGTETIEGILVDMPGSDEIHLSDMAFANMKRLRLLIVRNACFSGGPDYLPNSLRWLEWSDYPSPSLPPDFHPKKLAVLKLNFGSMAHLWDGFKRCLNLTIMELNKCHSLLEIPDVSTIPNLEKLIVNQCTNLAKVHESVGFMEKLVVLIFGDCPNLRSLPERLRLPALETLRLSGCTSLDKFPDILEHMEHVRSINLSESAVEELPSSIGNLTGLEHLDLHSCRKLRALPSSIYSLQKVVELHLKDCTNLLEFPTYIDSASSGTKQDVSLRFGLPMLEFLDASNCGIMALDFLEAPNCFLKLETLDLSGNNVPTLSLTFNKFSELKNLYLNDCKQLREILEFPSNMSLIDAQGCDSLERVYAWNLQSASEFKIDLSNCHKLRNDLATNDLLDKAFTGETEFYIIISGGDIPCWFNHQFTNNSMCFEIHSDVKEKLVGLGISIAFCLEDRMSTYLKCDLTVNNELVDSLSCAIDESLKLDHLWLGYFPLPRNLTEMQEGWNLLEVSFEFLDEVFEVSQAMKLKGCGIHFVGTLDEEKMNGSIVLRSLCPGNSGPLKEEAACSRSMDHMEDVMFTCKSAGPGSSHGLLRKRRWNGTDAAFSRTTSSVVSGKKRCYRRLGEHWILARMGQRLKLTPFNIKIRKARMRKGN